MGSCFAGTTVGMKPLSSSCAAAKKLQTLGLLGHFWSSAAMSTQDAPSDIDAKSNRADEAQATEWDASLRDDIRLLGRILGDTVRDQEGADVFDLVERVRRTSIRFHRDEDRAARRELESILDSLS